MGKKRYSRTRGDTAVMEKIHQDLRRYSSTTEDRYSITEGGCIKNRGDTVGTGGIHEDYGRYSKQVRYISMQSGTRVQEYSTQVTYISKQAG